jgi:hypothetical protein
VRDALALLDDEQVHQPGQRIAQEPEVALPVARRVGEGPHLVERQGQRGAIALAGGQAQVAQDLAGADP